MPLLNNPTYQVTMLANTDSIFIVPVATSTSVKQEIVDCYITNVATTADSVSIGPEFSTRIIVSSDMYGKYIFWKKNMQTFKILEIRNVLINE